jgi:hypothetical protein
MARIQGGVKFTSYINQVLKDMDRKEKGNRSKASALYRDEIKNTLAAHANLRDLREQKRKAKGKGGIPGPPGMETGTLYLNIDKYDGKGASYAGAMAPAYHMHLLEFGTKKSPAYPVVGPTGVKISPQLIVILSEPIA